MNEQELNKHIAVMKGWKPRVMQEREYQDLYDHGFGVTGWVQVYDCDELMFEYLPNWTVNLSDAITLVDGMPVSLSSMPLQGWGDKNNSTWRAEISWKPQSFVAYANTPAMAVAMAYLEYLTRPPIENR